MQVDDSFYGLSDLSSYRTYNFDKPTIISKEQLYRQKKLHDSGHFWDAFLKRYGFFRGVSLDGMFISGGSIIDTLFRLNSGHNDVDVYVIIDGSEENREEKFQARIRKFIDELLATCSLGAGNKLSLYRYRNVYTLKFSFETIQFSLRKSLSDHYRHVDLTCTETIYYKGELLFTAKSKEAVENGVTEINRFSESHNFQKRIKKYYDRGFGIILSDLDVSKISRKNFLFGEREICDLPFITFHLDNLVGNEIVTNKITFPNGTCDTDDDDYNFQSFREGHIIRHNVKCLVQNRPDQFIYYGKGAFYSDAFRLNIMLTHGMIEKTFRRIGDKILRQGFEIASGNIRKFFDYDDSQFLDVFAKLFSAKNLDDAMRELCKEEVLKCKDKLHTLMATNRTIKKKNKKKYCTKSTWYGRYLA